jgi:hypothetical protein
LGLSRWGSEQLKSIRAEHSDERKKIGRNDGLQFIVNLRDWNWGIKKREPLENKGSGSMGGGQCGNGYIYTLMTKSLFQGSFF